MTSSYYAPPLHEESEEEVLYGRDDRETTDPPEVPANKDASTYDRRPFIEVRFDKIPKSSHGLLFGCSRQCDVILPNFKGLSNYHFSLTFDEQNRFIVQDLGSGGGTEVTYDNKGQGTRHKFSWILGGDGNAHRHTTIIIKVHHLVKFQVVAVEHDVKSQLYVDNVASFRRGGETKECLINDLAIFRRYINLTAGAQMPGQGPIHVRRKVGEGGFGIAVHCWDVSTGDEFGIKTPTKKVVKKVLKSVEDRRAWKQEADTLRKLRHLLGVVCNPPELRLEYIPGGSLSELEGKISVPDTVLVLTQCLSALSYLHAKQLAHRDISPNNILIRSRAPFNVVLADFGMCQDAKHLRTRCGTTQYAAPEIFEDSSAKGYSVAVDIWSLGVTACSILQILPSYSEHKRNLKQGTTKLSWCQTVADFVANLYNSRPDSLKRLLLGSMLVLSPEGRNSAQACYERARRLPELMVNGRTRARISEILWCEPSIVAHWDSFDANERSTIRLDQAALVATARNTDSDEPSVDGPNPADSCSDRCETRRTSSSPPPSSRRSEPARSALKRPIAEIAHQSPSSKRRVRASDSQSWGYSVAHELDGDVNEETAEAASMLDDSEYGENCQGSPSLGNTEQLI
ncbi:hypothetical protein ED733_001624 [Metarhizium rileyi]|uniref:CAMK family protein kinase n=1 Tax=Metarhizium rileyi (strain RCEF 4871) TaxID=1649241 RepID=A0A5C6G0C2_METRR|nr:hypothetical protein ED733_001624 [Metarhizium rileyi]